MKEITFKIPEHRLDFVMQLMDELGIETADAPDIPEEHKAIVMERIEQYQPENLRTWEEVKKRLHERDK
ncbi:MAG: addiction module protein [Candidatus Cyclonatronum sp.]|uniref:addiction module protein n=1 Tax=Cyclonatronum sp. TaxID=3024185 RepID=UPI0025B86DBA|nr:addiction module protein [Cyclonatronum sp.]MCH8486385.1 addiction module protein [Cyclonatronum sp.]